MVTIREWNNALLEQLQDEFDKWKKDIKSKGVLGVFDSAYEIVATLTFYDALFYIGSEENDDDLIPIKVCKYLIKNGILHTVIRHVMKYDINFLSSDGCEIYLKSDLAYFADEQELEEESHV